MSVFFVDPDSGSDAADGLSFANRWKTLTSGATAARIAPGDTIRLIASPGPATPGSATWTDTSGTVTWAAAKNKVIDNCETNWTAAANVTCALQTSGMKQGSAAQGITPAAGFTTGKLAYRTLPATLDLSAHEQVSLWVQYGALVTAGQLELKLCSDATGDTPVDTLALPAGESGQWQAVVLNKAAALGAAIASVALYATADPGTTMVQLDNIVACKAAASVDCVTHRHVIGKNTVGEPDWYAILSIADDSVILGGARGIGIGTPPQPYRGLTESIATYVLRGLDAWTSAQYSVMDSGTDALPITFSGGWNRTDMSTQTGVSYFNGAHLAKAAMTAGTREYIRIEKVGGLLMADAVVTDSGAKNLDLDLEQAVGCGYGPFYTMGFPVGAQRIRFDSAQGITFDSGIVMSNGEDVFTEVLARRIHGCVGTAAVTPYPRTRLAIDKIDNNAYAALDLVNLTTGTSAELIGTEMGNNVTDLYANGCRGTLIADGSTFAAPALATNGARVKASRYGAAATDHRIFAAYFTVVSATDQRHTASGVSWKVSPTSAANCNSRAPAQFTLARIAVNASALVTVKCWLRRDNTGLSAGLRVLGKSFPGVGASDVQTLMSAAIDTWEEITMTFTPTAAGVVDVLGVAWGGATYNGWFDDLTITQA